MTGNTFQICFFVLSHLLISSLSLTLYTSSLSPPPYPPVIYLSLISALYCFLHFLFLSHSSLSHLLVSSLSPVPPFCVCCLQSFLSYLFLRLPYIIFPSLSCSSSLLHTSPLPSFPDSYHLTFHPAFLSSPLPTTCFLISHTFYSSSVLIILSFSYFFYSSLHKLFFIFYFSLIFFCCLSSFLPFPIIRLIILHSPLSSLPLLFVASLSSFHSTRHSLSLYRSDGQSPLIFLQFFFFPFSLFLHSPFVCL